ncbi:MAG: deoxyribodipyrimidine photo-lyase [Anaerolineae bacterium]|nr:MAG: deoxyribodipyrimidine photo-lyase [Anaerolineae bacterium]
MAGKPFITSALWWIRRDLRLTDNQALAAALACADRAIPVFVLDPKLWASPYVGDKRLAFLLSGLRQLDADLRARGSRLVVRQGDPRDELATLTAESGAEAIFAEEDFSPYAQRRDRLVVETLPLQLTPGLTVHPPDMTVKADGTPYTVFTPFSRKWKALPPPQAADVLPAPDRLAGPPDVWGLPIPADPALPATLPFPPGEAEARRRLRAFTDGDHPPIYSYGERRNRLDVQGTSQLSPYLRFGMLSARQAAVAALGAAAAAPNAEARQGAETWLNELIWREFYVAILHHFPDVRRHSFRANLRAIAWENDEAAFAAWCEGHTGYPVIDAAMRQLVQEGWMHNRARMIVASFLVKDLLIDWRWGERWFMQHLVDGDPAANNGGWQWTAGTGTDAAPYFRVFNPVLQGKKFDPDGAYVRRWVPELRRVPDKFIHQPWQMPLEVQQAAGCVVGQDYPAPIVDHAWARERVLAAYAKARGAESD